MAHIQNTRPTSANHMVDQATQTEPEARPSLPEHTATPDARRHTPGSHPLAYRISTDTVTGSTTPQALQTVHPHSHAAHADGSADAGIQTMHHDSIRSQTRENVRGLFSVTDNQTSVGLKQDIALAREIALASAVPSPKGTLASDCVCLPPDLMAYRVTTADGNYKLRYNCPEINGTGFCGIRDIHPEQLQQVMRTYKNAGQEIAADAKAKGEVPLIIVANSGRERTSRKDGVYPEAKSSKMIWEKMYVADVLAEALATPHHDVFATSLDSHVTAYYKEIDAIAADNSLSTTQRTKANDAAYQNATKRMAKHKDEPMVMLGYSRDMAACCKVENGRPTLFGRPVHGVVNDRGLQNLAMTENKELSYLKFRPMNASVTEGVDKFAAAQSRAAFLESDDFKQLANIAKSRGFTFDPMGVEQVRHFPRNGGEPVDLSGKNDLDKYETRATYFRGVTAAEGEDGVRAAVRDFAKIGLTPLFKPNGSGQSKGIIAPEKGQTEDQFIEAFKKNLKEIEQDFGKGAGFPFMVMPLLQLDSTPANEAYDLRFATYQNTDDKEQGTIHSVPLILKKEPPKAKPSSAGELQFTPTNVTAAVAATGKKGTDFIVSLCSQEGMEQSHLSVDQLKSIGLYFASHEAWMLKTDYPRAQALTQHPGQSTTSVTSTDTYASSGDEGPARDYRQVGISMGDLHLNTQR